MKLRHALGAAAAAAVIAPLALLSAPAAFAEEPASESPSASVSAPASADVTPATSAPESTPASSAPASTPASSAPASTPASSAPATGSAPASTPPSRSAEPTADPTPCTDTLDDPDSQLSLSVSGLPGKIVAGSGWHPFTLTAANHSSQSLGQVQWLAIVDNDSMSEHEKDWLSTYARLEYLNPKTKTWESLADQVGNGIYFGETPLGPRQTVAIQLRVDITAHAPAGGGYTVGLGGYVDQEKNCVHNAFAYYEFTVLKPGTPNDRPGHAKPGKGSHPTGGKQPQGGAEEIPPTGSLAHTGADSALPMIGLVGGAAVVAGAGTVVLMRRRRAGADA
ncbi:LPXTG cell wall anchor domain-containing protein [Streptomyces tropicalis]|uniref:LPXTG cell wall anchor domain-containing protein n=1 Tax=Streptomyces tropicalis TaxID=3034234 RepID=A0ABT6A9I6_9ACTN|nr:LPXTG cell wall anchor domain-containing protein [Streptomyces tropicalis]MDF3301087.1 LPXTG cell wall anchor domain-containing protein [Streptomyces tropicalis]